MAGNGNEARKLGTGQRAALMLAGTGVAWVVATELGGYFGMSQRYLALFDLFALAGFGWGLWMTLRLWRERQNDKG